MKLWESLDFKVEEGKQPPKDLTVFALSTCGFCKSALRYLRKNKIAFRYIYLDSLHIETRKSVKKALQETFGERPMFPFLVIGDDQHLIGFDEDEWKEFIDSSGDDNGESDDVSQELTAPELAPATKFVTMVADKQGWNLPKDNVLLLNLVKGLTTNKERYGYYLCPCRIGDGVKRKDKDIICPCDYSRPDIEEYGHCFCALYQSAMFQKIGKKPKSIPERRPEG